RKLQSVAQRRSLITAQHGTGVSQGAVVGEGEIGRTVIDGVARGALDAELCGDVGGEGEERQRLGAAAAEAPAQGVGCPRAQSMAPTEALAPSQAVNRILESEELFGACAAIGDIEVAIDAVFLGQIVSQPQASVIGV